MRQYSTIGLMGRFSNTNTGETFEHLYHHLHSLGLNVIVDADLEPQLPFTAERTETAEQLGRHCDMVVVVGGDGSMLAAGRVLCEYDVPVLGVNRGRLGFLTDVTPAMIEQSLAAVLAGEFVVEKRFLLEMGLEREDQSLGSGVALNDVVLNSGFSARMIEFELYIDDDFVYRQRSDGLIVSTPTGSTAYALSAGGPITHPRLNALMLVPMNPHTLSSRPLVVDGDSLVRVQITDYNEVDPVISCDGQVNLNAGPGDIVHVRKKSAHLTLLHPPGHSFYATCREKLGWGNRPGEA